MELCPDRHDEDTETFLVRIDRLQAEGHADRTDAGEADTMRIFDEGGDYHEISAADATATEAPGAELAFVVALDRAAVRRVTVDYRTEDGSATAGSDYVAAGGTLEFARGQTALTVAVAVLDDAVDDAGETMTLRLADASGAFLADAAATGTITNDDPMPAAWLARFGRTVATHAVDMIGGRLEESGARESYVALGGVRFGDDGRAAAPDGATPANGFGATNGFEAANGFGTQTNGFGTRTNGFGTGSGLGTPTNGLGAGGGFGTQTNGFGRRTAPRPTERRRRRRAAAPTDGPTRWRRCWAARSAGRRRTKSRTHAGRRGARARRRTSPAPTGACR